MAPISAVPSPLAQPIAPQTASGAQQGSFTKLLMQSLEHVNQMQQNADRAVEQLVTGGDVNMAEVMTSVQKADLTFKLMMQIRNKLVQAYQEIQEVRI